MSRQGNAEGFWDFSVRTYRTDGVADACLSLQNDHGADVNMLLYCCWVGASKGKFDKELFARSSEFSAQWAGNAVKPLRSARKWMKHTGCVAESVPTEACMTLREDIKSAEFSAEKMQQEVLESFVTGKASRGDTTDNKLEAVIANLMRYREYANINDSDDARRKIAIVIKAAFPDWDEALIQQTLNRR